MRGLHHVEVWVAYHAAALPSWSWLLSGLGFACTSTWPDGSRWDLDATYVVLESGPDVRPTPHDRLRPGLNHLAFWAGSPADVDRLVRDAGAHGWTPLFAEQYPHAGGPDHYAAYLENHDGFEVELVARRT
jgi:catechol 2,3-dioxygenase-like lactoylglutathione lyase family enzyme